MPSVIVGTTEAAAKVIDRIVAVVNNDVILLSELNKRFKPFEARLGSQGYTPEQERQMRFKIREDLLNQLIDETLTNQEITRLKIVVLDREIDAMIERIKEANYYTDEELREGLLFEGITFEEYRDQLKEQILRTKLVNYQVKSKIIITKEDIREYYDSHQESYGKKKRYRLRNIILRVPSFATQDEKELVRKKIEGIHDQLEAGEPFDKTAELFSESPLAERGGYLGEFGSESLSSQIKESVENLEAGGITDVLDTDQGFQIFFVEEVLYTGGKSLEEAGPEIEEMLYKQIVDNKFDEWLADLRQGAHIKIIK